METRYEMQKEEGGRMKTACPPCTTRAVGALHSHVLVLLLLSVPALSAP